MGYKLAGFDVIGGVEIDPKMMEIYRANFNPKFSYLEGVQEFKSRTDLPQELFNLDILDGSPPCSSFSMAGSREKDWGKNKKFREGQAEQVLDDLFFHFIDIAKKLKPKVVIAENVKGLIQGNAIGYVKQIFKEFKEAGYESQLFLLNSSRMGVPQIRERVFFISRRSDLCLPKISFQFNEPNIPLSRAFKGIDPYGATLTPMQLSLWKRTAPGKAFSTADKRGFWFGAYKAHPGMPFTTLTAQGGNSEGYMWDRPNKISPEGHRRIQSFPDDYVFLNMKSHYVCGMSVPPFMSQRVALEVYKQFFMS